MSGTGDPFFPEISEIDTEIRHLFFPGEETIFVSIFAYISKFDHPVRIRAVTGDRLPDCEGMGLIEYTIQANWTVPNAGQMDQYREDSAYFDSQTQSVMINNFTVRNLIISHHLRKLSMSPDWGEFKLEYNRRNQLSGRTLASLKKLHSGIFDTLYSKFTTESCLIFEIN